MSLPQRRPPYQAQQSAPFSSLNSNRSQQPILRQTDSFGSLLDEPKRLSSGSGSQHSGSVNNPFQDPAMFSTSSHSQSSKGISSKFSLHPDPNMWGYDVSPRSVEDDDWLHNPDKRKDTSSNIFTGRGFTTIGCLFLLATALVGLFLGYPLTYAILHKAQSTNGGFNLGGINATGQIMQTTFSLIDKDTPSSAYTKTSLHDGKQMQLVFSDEFNVDGRTFYPGDDPFWEAVDLYYWGTKDLEWYDPQQVTTKDGKLVISFKHEPNHDLEYMGGMLTTWNKFCFTGGYIETSVQLPGNNAVTGWWPAVWTMGNLGRAGYGATTDGMWPYSYEKCDRGTLKNQTQNGLPDFQDMQAGDKAYAYSLSYLPGQRLSSCTCPGELHPGPVERDGSFRGRSAPEIDIFEAQIDEGLGGVGAASQSAQFAPYNAFYSWDNATFADFLMPAGSQKLNGFKGNVYQMATSVVSKTNQLCYELSDVPCYSVYGFQYKPGYESDDAHITWVNDNKLAWRLRGGAVGADAVAGIGERVIPKEPMYIIANLGMSPGFSAPDFEHLTIPATMKVDYIRVYQYADAINYGCDPPNYPTTQYIERFAEAYSNPNITTWTGSRLTGGFEEKFPKNRLIDTC